MEFKNLITNMLILCILTILILPLAVEGAEFRLKYAHVQPDKHVTNLSALWMADELKKRSNGRVEMQVFPGGVLGRPNDMLDSLQSGDLDFAWVSTAELSPSIKEFNLISISYLFKNLNHWKEIFLKQDSYVVKRFSQAVENSPYGIKWVGPLGGASRQLYNSQREIKTLADIKGLRLRIQHSPVEAKVWSALGVIPQQLAWTEIYTSLQTGVVQGAESSLDAYVQNKFYEVAPYFSYTNHQFSTQILLMSKKTYEKLPPDLRKIVYEAGYESCLMCFKWWSEGEKEAQRQAEAKGAKFSHPDTSAFQNRIAEIMKTEASKYKVENILEAIKKAAK